MLFDDIYEYLLVDFSLLTIISGNFVKVLLFGISTSKSPLYFSFGAAKITCMDASPLIDKGFNVSINSKASILV